MPASSGRLSGAAAPPPLLLLLLLLLLLSLLLLTRLTRDSRSSNRCSVLDRRPCAWQGRDRITADTTGCTHHIEAHAVTLQHLS
jgi:hypothetical protein